MALRLLPATSWGSPSLLCLALKRAPAATPSSREIAEGVERRFCIVAHHRQLVHAAVSPSHSLGDPPVITAQPGAKVSQIMFSVEGRSRGGSLAPEMYWPVR